MQKQTHTHTHTHTLKIRAIKENNVDHQHQASIHFNTFYSLRDINIKSSTTLTKYTPAAKLILNQMLYQLDKPSQFAEFSFMNCIYQCISRFGADHKLTKGNGKVLYISDKSLVFLSNNCS